jgi:two-component sensor histidine kinase
MHESMFIGLAQNAALLLALVVVFDTIGLRFRKGTILIHRLALGLVIGAIGLGVMVTPMPVVPGVVFDTRSVLLGISGLFFGSFPTIIAMAMTAAYRLIQGGSGAMTGTFVIIATGSMGILWRRSCRHQMESTRWYEFYLFGVLSHLVMLALMLTLPIAVRGKVLSAISLPVMALYPLATVMLGLLLSKRVRRENAANELRESEEHLRAAEAESRRLLSEAERSRMALLSVVEDKQDKENRIQALLDEKELLLKETHHRIKNNMGTINSLLSLQANDQIDPAAKTVLDDAAQRLQSMMVLYDKLYRSENYGELSVKEYLPALIAEIVGAFPIAVPVVTDIQVDDFTLSAKILSNIGIIMNELVANSMKYAFGSTERGLIHISAAVDGSKVRFVYADDGAGLPHTVDFEHSTGFGLQLVQLLVRQIGGTIRIDREEGTRYVIELER